jgi:hypothetical protein
MQDSVQNDGELSGYRNSFLFQKVCFLSKETTVTSTQGTNQWTCFLLKRKKNPHNTWHNELLSHGD